MAEIATEGKLSLEERLYRVRHSAAHVMAEAVLRLFPDAKIAIGPPIENGFATSLSTTLERLRGL